MWIRSVCKTHSACFEYPFLSQALDLSAAQPLLNLAHFGCSVCEVSLNVPVGTNSATVADNTALGSCAPWAELHSLALSFPQTQATRHASQTCAGTRTSSSTRLMGTASRLWPFDVQTPLALKVPTKGSDLTVCQLPILLTSLQQAIVLVQEPGRIIQSLRSHTCLRLPSDMPALWRLESENRYPRSLKSSSQGQNQLPNTEIMNGAVSKGLEAHCLFRAAMSSFRSSYVDGCKHPANSQAAPTAVALTDTDSSVSSLVRMDEGGV